MTNAAIDTGDSQCLQCGYNLRGLAPDANCPECGRIVSASMEGSPLWRTLRVNYFGALRAAMLLMLVGTVLATAQMTAYLFVPDLYRRPDVRTASYLLPLPSLLGTWLLTRLPGDRVETTARHWIRLIIRVTVMLIVCGQIVSMLLPTMVVAPGGPMFADATRLSITLSDVVRRALTIVFLFLLARTLGHSRTIKFAIVMLPVVAVACIIELETNLLYLLAISTTTLTTVRLYRIAGSVYAPVELVCVVTYFVLLLVMRHRLRKQIDALQAEPAQIGNL